MPVNPCCCAVPCVTDATCEESASAYTLTLPTAVNFGSCTYTATCTPSLTTLLMTQFGSACIWDHNKAVGDIGQKCIAGYLWGPVGGGVVARIDQVTIGGCQYWRLQIFGEGLATPYPVLTLVKERTSATDTPAGTYTFYSLTVNGVTCSGASITGTVSVA